MRNPAQEIIEAMQILIDNAMKKITHHIKQRLSVLEIA